jgi:hypothetical protein
MKIGYIDMRKIYRFYSHGGFSCRIPHPDPHQKREREKAGGIINSMLHLIK